MKKHLLKSLLALALVLVCGNVWGETVTYTFTPDKTTTGSSSTAYVTSAYSFTYNDIGWSFNQWNPSTLQVRTNQSSADSEFNFKNTSAFPGKITSVVITFSALTVSDASKLCFVGGTSAISNLSGGTAGTWNSTAKTLTWTPLPTDNFTYFAFYQDGKAASGTNYLASSNAIVVTYEANTQTKTLTSIAISGTPDKTEYKEVDTFDPAGLVVTGTYDDNSQQAISAGITWAVTPETLTVGTTSVSITAKVGEKESAPYTVNGITVAERDFLFYESFDTNDGKGGNDYGWSGSSIASNNFQSDNKNWAVTSANGANKCAKFGTTDKKGSATTPPINCSGNVILTFKAGAWNATNEKTTLNISAEGGTVNQSSVSLTKGAWTEYSISITGITESVKIKFEAADIKNNRFFLDEVKVCQAKSHSVTIAASGYSTLYLDYDAEVPEGVTAFYATEYDATNDQVVLTEVTNNVIAANQGVVLKGTAGTEYSFVETASATAPTANLLHGTVASEGISGLSGEDGDYILKNGAFAPVSGGTLAAHKAYLHVDGRSTSTASSSIGIRFDGATMIDSLSADMEEDIYFDLQGRKVENPTSGLYIVNGKKVMVK